ncbi:hypothetical protein AWC14_21355 [Mycobacterium kyorinense]|uniref:ESX-1 secretion-associated protein n=1 Tax=Mycobacterium kyorinense TaxID=487514 RepID=A0A1X1YFI1_9MYCO|nr:hypothetical protein AWC14_21355 [Mycobacterium kyorinense]
MSGERDASVAELRVDPTELHLTATQLEAHADEFSAAHQQAHSRASQVSIGSGAARAALPQMLEEWAISGTRFKEHHIRHADGHREAADRYIQADDRGADQIEDAGSAL